MLSRSVKFGGSDCHYIKEESGLRSMKWMRFLQRRWVAPCMLHVMIYDFTGTATEWVPLNLSCTCSAERSRPVAEERMACSQC